MSKLVRLSENEQEAIREKALQINKLLVKKGLQPLKDSELVHRILDLSIAYTQVNPDGSLFMAWDDPATADNCGKVGV